LLKRFAICVARADQFGSRSAMFSNRVSPALKDLVRDATNPTNRHAIRAAACLKNLMLRHETRFSSGGNGDSGGSFQRLADYT